MNEGMGMAKLDSLDVQRHAERTMERYQYLGQLMEEVVQASNNGDRAEIGRLIDMISHKHAECSADIKAIMRLAE
ncbi:MAG: hypothetical protein K6G49_02370 [Candidatus Saccharibacteria bacterium]|nr:hypothetical protein [Candidatus Saccharibacteria bacterium]